MIRRFIFRADASPSLGGGHVMRCLTLAGVLAARGAECRFVCGEGSQAVAPALAHSGFPVTWLHDPSSIPEALAAMSGRADAIVIDHYGLGAQAEHAFRACARLVVAIDDLADRPHACDVLIDHTLGRTSGDYARLTAPETGFLLGPRYAFLRQAFLEARPKALARRASGGPVRRILVSMGLSDVGGVTGPAVEAALQAAPDARIDVVLATQAPSRARVEALAARAANVVVHPADIDLCPLMAVADLAVGAGGTTGWERCCLGLPSVVAIVADNQALNTQRMAASGAARLVHGVGDIAAALADLARDEAARRTMTARAAALISGDGAGHVADILLHRTGDAAAIRGAVFFDRDGVLNVDHGYVGQAARFEWMDGAREAVKRVNDLGLYAFVITNQSGVARGMYTEDDVRALHAHMEAQLAEIGARIDAFAYCPDHPEAVIEKYRRASPRRKPAPGMLLDLLAAWPVDVSASLVVGDQQRDMDAAARAGLRGARFPGGRLDAWLAPLLPPR